MTTKASRAAAEMRRLASTLAAPIDDATMASFDRLSDELPRLKRPEPAERLTVEAAEREAWVVLEKLARFEGELTKALAADVMRYPGRYEYGVERVPDVARTFARWAGSGSLTADIALVRVAAKAAGVPAPHDNAALAAWLWTNAHGSGCSLLHVAPARPL